MKGGRRKGGRKGTSRGGGGGRDAVTVMQIERRRGKRETEIVMLLPGVV